MLAARGGVSDKVPATSRSATDCQLCSLNDAVNAADDKEGCYGHASQTHCDKQLGRILIQSKDGVASAHHVTDQATQRMVEPTN